jgi:hypothetical protein
MHSAGTNYKSKYPQIHQRKPYPGIFPPSVRFVLVFCAQQYTTGDLMLLGLGRVFVLCQAHGLWGLKYADWEEYVWDKRAVCFESTFIGNSTTTGSRAEGRRSVSLTYYKAIRAKSGQFFSQWLSQVPPRTIEEHPDIQLGKKAKNGAH